MAIYNWPVPTSVKRKIEKCVENHQELYWQRTRRDELQLRAVTYTWETGKFRSKKLFVFDGFTDEDLDDLHKLQVAVMSLFLERDKNLAPSGLEKFLRDMFFDGIISRTLEKM